MAFITGQTVADMKDSTIMIRNVALVSITGQMDANTKVGGTRASSTVLEPIWIQQKKKLNSVYGKAASALNGLMSNLYNRYPKIS